MHIKQRAESVVPLLFVGNEGLNSGKKHMKCAAASTDKGKSEGMDRSQGYLLSASPEGLKILVRKLAVLPRSAWWEEGVEFWVMA